MRASSEGWGVAGGGVAGVDVIARAAQFFKRRRPPRRLFFCSACNTHTRTRAPPLSASLVSLSSLDERTRNGTIKTETKLSLLSFPLSRSIDRSAMAELVSLVRSALLDYVAHGRLPPEALTKALVSKV